MSFRTLVVGLVCSFVLSLPFSLGYRPKAEPFWFEVEISTDTRTHAQIYFDLGDGLNESHSIRREISPTSRPALVRFPLPSGTYRALRFDPADRTATIVLRDARIVDLDGNRRHTFAPSDFSPQQQVASVTVDDGGLRVVASAGANDPTLAVRLDEPLSLTKSDVFARWIRPALPITVSWLAFTLLVWRLPRGLKARLRDRASAWWTILCRHPRRTIAGVALVAVVASSYPIVFLGKSFVSPNFSDGTLLLYDRFPTLPGYDSAVTEDAHGADVGAIIWQHVPYAMIQRDALAHGDLPLWNRYNSAGTVLLAQGQSMFGDPMQAIVLLGGGEAWAWDVKYLAAKWLLCLFLGLIVFHVTRHLPSAALAAFAAAFLGFFIYRVNHPAFFSFCYAPAILYIWLRLADARGPRSLAAWGGALVLASWAEVHSGTVKEAYMLALGMNATGLLAAWFSLHGWRERIRVFLAGSWAGIILVLLSAPTWLTFVDTLRAGLTSYDMPTAFQISPSFTLGLFDEIFYRPLQRGERVVNPSANFLVLLGVLYFLSAFREAGRSPTARAIAISALVPFVFAFGVVPPQWIIHLPFIGQIAHIDNTLSCILIIQLVVLAGFGWRAAFRHLGGPEGRRHLVRLCWAYAILVALWLAYLQVVHRPTFGNSEVVSLLPWGHRVPASAAVWGSLVALTLAGAALLATARVCLARQRLGGVAGLCAATAIAVLLWRHGAHGDAVGPDDYVFNPSVRAPFREDSPALDALKRDRSDPARVVGIYGNLMPGWTAAQQLETISGPDAIQNRFYQELLHNLGFEIIWGWRVYLTLDNVARSKPLLDFLNVGYYADLHDDPRRLSPLLTPVVAEDLAIYRSDTAWPRAFFAPGIVTYTSLNDLRGRIERAAGRPFAAMDATDMAIVPELAALVRDGDPGHTSPASNYALGNHTTSFTIDATGPGVAVLHETWLRDDFIATIDGQAVPYFRVNHAFKAVTIPSAGSHVIRFDYRPRHFSFALALAGVGMVFAAATVLLAWKARPAAAGSTTRPTAMAHQAGYPS